MEAVGEYGGLSLDQTRVIADIGSGYTELDEGDIVVAKTTPCFENGKGALAAGLTNEAAFGTTELHVLRAHSTLERRFLFYFTLSRLFRSTGEGEMCGAGGQKRVPPEFCKNTRLPLPPIVDQRAIADFLDRETARMDDMVRESRQRHRASGGIPHRADHCGRDRQGRCPGRGRMRMPFNIGENVVYYPPHISPRLRAQDSVLLACQQPFEALAERDCLEIVIRHDAHDDIRRRLDQYGVFDRQLFRT
jgi:hypothetical protein